MNTPKSLGIVHTSFVLVELLNGLAQQHLPGTRIVNIVDDSIVDDVAEHAVNESMRKRMKNLLQAAVDAGSSIILSACSSVGEAVDDARKDIPVPLVRIDEAMAEKAVTLGRRIGIFATAASTLEPTTRLLKTKAAAAGVAIEAIPQLCPTGFKLLRAGRVTDHDRLVTESVMATARQCDVVLFAQASMFPLACRIAPQLDRPLLTSPELAMMRLRERLSET